MPGAEYEALRGRLKALLRGLRTPAGRTVVRDLVAVARRTGRPPEALPDLVVHRAEAALEMSLVFGSAGTTVSAPSAA